MCTQPASMKGWARVVLPVREGGETLHGLQAAAAGSGGRSSGGGGGGSGGGGGVWWQRRPQWRARLRLRLPMLTGTRQPDKQKQSLIHEAPAPLQAAQTAVWQQRAARIEKTSKKARPLLRPCMADGQQDQAPAVELLAPGRLCHVHMMPIALCNQGTLSRSRLRQLHQLQVPYWRRLAWRGVTATTAATAGVTAAQCSKPAARRRPAQAGVHQACLPGRVLNTGPAKWSVRMMMPAASGAPCACECVRPARPLAVQPPINTLRLVGATPLTLRSSACIGQAA